MNVEFIKINELSTNKVEFYTVRLDEDELDEFDKFIETPFPAHEEEITIIFSAIKAMGSHGAREYYFKTNEGPADALPKVSNEIKDANNADWGVRLYCIRLSDQLVVLLNGGIKTKKDPLECRNVKQHFKRAYRIAQIIDKMVIDRELSLIKKSCLNGLIIEI